MKQTPLLSKSAAEERHTARLLCEATGVPNVTFSWSRVGDEQDFEAEDSKKYQILNSGVDPMTWKSEFLIRDVQKSDYGQYECIARNNEGKNGIYQMNLFIKVFLKVCTFSKNPDQSKGPSRRSIESKHYCGIRIISLHIFFRAHYVLIEFTSLGAA